MKKNKAIYCRVTYKFMCIQQAESDEKHSHTGECCQHRHHQACCDLQRRTNIFITTTSMVFAVHFIIQGRVQSAPKTLYLDQFCHFVRIYLLTLLSMHNYIEAEISSVAKYYCSKMYENKLTLIFFNLYRQLDLIHKLQFIL